MQEPAATFDQFTRGWRGYALIALIALLSALLGVTRMPVLEGDEARLAYMSRLAAEGGDVRGALHWLQATAAEAASPLTGRLNVIWPYRMPSVLGLALAAIATFWAGAAILDRRAALFGAGLLAAGMLAGFKGMSASADAVLLGAIAAAFAALAQLRVQNTRPARSPVLVFWTALACGLLIDGVLAAVSVGLTLVLLVIWERRASWLAPLLWWPGPALGLAIASAGLAAFGAPAVDSGPADTVQLPGHHLFLLPFLIFPATYALPAAARLTWETVRAPRADEAHAGLRFLCAWALSMLAALELTGGQGAGDALPAYPALTLLCGAGLIAMRGRPWRTVHPAGLVLFGVAGAVLVALSGAIATFMPGDFATDIRRAISAGLIGLGVVGAALAALLMLRQPSARAAVLIVCALILSFSLRERLAPEAREAHVSSEITAALTRARLLPRTDRALWVVGYDEPSLQFLTRAPIQVSDAAMAGAGAGTGDAIVIEARQLEDLETALATRGLQFQQAEPPVRGLSLAQGGRVALLVGQVSAAAADDLQPNL